MKYEKKIEKNQPKMFEMFKKKITQVTRFHSQNFSVLHKMLTINIFNICKETKLV